MADTKITGLTALTTPAAADLIAVVDDVVGTPTTKKVALSDLLTSYIEANISIQEANISDLGTYLTDIVSDTTPQLGGSLDVNGNSIVSTSNGNITLAPNGTGDVVLGNFTFDADQTVGAGQDNYVLTYDNATGKISLEASAGGGGGLADVVDDTTPQLGGNLDVNGNKIVSVSNGNIDIEPNGTGNVLLGNFVFDADQTVGAGQDNYVLTYDNGTGLISLEASAGGGGLTLPYSDGDSVTGSASTATFELTPTWNTTGTPIALNIDVTRTAAADGNNLIAARYNSSGNPSFGVASVTGSSATLNGVSLRNASAATAVTIGGNAITNVTNGMGIVIGGFMVGNITRYGGIEASEKLGIYTGSQTLNSGGKADVELYRDAAYTLALRTSTNPYTLNIYNTYTDGSNYERGSIFWSSNVFTIDTQEAGTGSARGIQIGAASSATIGFYGATPVAQQSTTGTTTGFTAGVGTSANDDSTYTGGSGTAAYTVGDIVLALKNVGILAAS